DVDALLGHKPRTVTELRAVTQ
ncbi:hypothetical protein SASC598J21_002240, partial [Snodgrassella alvi SCGC AB-598-J21]